MAEKIPQFKYDRDMIIVNLGDIHRGSNNCNSQFFRDTVALIAKTPNARWISTGDMLEVATKMSIGGPYDASTVDEEFDKILVELAPITNKCLGMVGSNHHERIRRTVGLNLDKRLANELGIPYLGISGCINITCGKASYFCMLHHGVGGGTAGNKINRAHKVASIHAGADIYFSGHTHAYSHTPFLQRYVDRKRNIISEMTCHSIVTGHCLEWKGSYAEYMALPPLPIGFSATRLKACGSGRVSDKLVTSTLLTPNSPRI